MTTMEQLLHFTHDHPLSLIHLQSDHKNESSDEEEEEEEEEEEDDDESSYKEEKEKDVENSDDEEQEKDEDEDDFVFEDNHVRQCKMCMEQIYSFHMSYYNCKDCDYSLHKFCAEMPTILQNHVSHPQHNLTLSKGFQDAHAQFTSESVWTCGVCKIKRKNFYNYHCSICKINIDIICAIMSQQKVDHPSHPHQLQRISKKLVSCCDACGHEHQGTFYQCTTCFLFSIHEDCALMPAKLLIQHATNGTFTHSHPLTLAYSFPEDDRKARFYPRCRVCRTGFYIYFWIYKCVKCQYYVHIDCAIPKTAGGSKTYKNFKDDDYPNLLHCPFPDESYNLLRHYFLKNNKEFMIIENHGEMLNHFSHPHPLILLDTQTSLDNNSVVLHNPMKKIQLLCDGCVKPITTFPFYKCSQEFQRCGFVLHEWCARLPSKVQDHPGHPEHTLFLMLNVSSRLFGIYTCDICNLRSNGFAYVCFSCAYCVDINCAFLPEEITHEAHPNHLLSRINASPDLSKKKCNSCNWYLKDCIGFHCPSCDFYLDISCAFLLPRISMHKYDKHSLSLRYDPVENHPGDYFCEICEDRFNPKYWFYHCTFCAQSMHPACAPLILGCQQIVSARYSRGVFYYANVKFGGTLEIKGHPHRLAFVQGIECHGLCKECDKELQYDMILQCVECEYVVHYFCVPF